MSKVMNFSLCIMHWLMYICYIVFSLVDILHFNVFTIPILITNNEYHNHILMSISDITVCSKSIYSMNKVNTESKRC